MSVVGKAAFYITPAVISAAGVVVTGYYTYKYFRIKKCVKETDSRSSESFYTAVDYQSSSEFSDAQDECPDYLEKDQLFERVDKLMQGDESGIEAAYREMKESLEFMSKDPNFLWRYAKIHHLKGKVKKNEACQLNAKGLKYAKEAVDNDPENPEAHKWFAILTGREAEFLQDNIKKANNGKIFFNHIQQALKLRPKDWELHHLLGVFEYKLASLSFFEKCAARFMFEDISKFEYRAAKKHFKTAEKYNPNPSKETKLFLAKCLCEEKKYEKALMCLNEALKLEIKSADDKACHKEIEHQIRLVSLKNPF